MTGNIGALAVPSRRSRHEQLKKNTPAAGATERPGCLREDRADRVARRGQTSGRRLTISKLRKNFRSMVSKARCGSTYHRADRSTPTYHPREQLLSSPPDLTAACSTLEQSNNPDQRYQADEPVASKSACLARQGADAASCYLASRYPQRMRLAPQNLQLDDQA